jgi:hypothetical protein
LAAARWLGWVTLMMYVLVQTVQSATGGNRPQLDAPGTRALSQASAQFDPQTHLVTVEAPAPTMVWNATPAIGSHGFVIPVRADAAVGPITAPLSPTPDETAAYRANLPTGTGLCSIAKWKTREQDGSCQGPFEPSWN